MRSDNPDSPDFEPSEWHKKEDSDRREIYNSISQCYDRIHISHNNFIEIKTGSCYIPLYPSDGYCSYKQEKIFVRKTEINAVYSMNLSICFFDKLQDDIEIYTIGFSIAEKSYWTAYFSRIEDRDMALLLFCSEL